MQYFLGVDGGGSGCRLRLADRSGAVLAECDGGPANIATDPEGARAHLERALGELLARAGLGRAALPDMSAAFGLAGANVSGAPGWGRDLPFGRLQIVTDAYTSTLGALGGADGIVAAIGTGSVFARMVRGDYQQIGGWGFHLGDEGSGAVLGRARLTLALRAHDGVRPMSPLAQETLAQFASPADLPAFAQSAAPADFARLAPALFAQSDPLAEAVLDAAGEEVSALITRLRAGTDLAVTWTGGLGPLWAARLQGHWPEAAPQGTALDGAMRLAFRPGDRAPCPL